MQRQVESDDSAKTLGRRDIEALVARLGGVKPAHACNGPATARSDAARALQAALGAVTPSRRTPEASSTSPDPAGLGTLVLPPPTPARRRRRLAINVGLVLSLLLHGGSLLAFLSWRGAETGAIEQPSESISVEIVASSTLEAAQPKQIPEPAPAPEMTAPSEGRTEAADTPAKTEPVPEQRLAEPQPLPVPEAPEAVEQTAREEAPGKVEAPPVPVQGPAEVLPEPPKAKMAEEEVEARRKEAKKVEREKPAERAPKGGVTSKAKAGRGTGGERASASTGSMLSYAADVRARVAGNKPAGVGSGGTVVVGFRVTAAGGLGSVGIARSSGNAGLDQLAVAAVRSAAPFPTPPSGATPAQLHFTVPFHFQ